MVLMLNDHLVIGKCICKILHVCTKYYISDGVGFKLQDHNFHKTIKDLHSFAIMEEQLDHEKPQRTCYGSCPYPGVHIHGEHSGSLDVHLPD